MVTKHKPYKTYPEAFMLEALRLLAASVEDKGQALHNHMIAQELALKIS